MRTGIAGTCISHHSISEALQDHYGDSVSIIKKRAVYGGDINRSYCLELSNGEKCFIKTNHMGMLGMFMAEANGLAALGSTDAIGVPQVFAAGKDRDAGCSFLLMEFLDQDSPVKHYWERFGRELAAMHRALLVDPSLRVQMKMNHPKGQSDKGAAIYGFFEDNYIGSTPQKNDWRKSFIDFYRDCRLVPQMQMAKNKLGKTALEKLDKLISRLDQFLTEPAFPSLLHGDLWSGNAVCGPDGKAWILDPAAYLGFYEADLAMTQLFGGFPSRFYEAYQEVNPINPGYADRRRIYDLYHMLNHLNLFGSGYAGSVRSILDFYV